MANKQEQIENVLQNEGGTAVNEQPAAPKKKPRAYYGDWIRATAISLVIFVHTLGVSYDSTDW